MERILESLRLVAQDRNKVFVEKANRKPFSPHEAEMVFGIDPCKGNAYIEFDIEEDLLEMKYNNRTEIDEWFIVGDIELANRNPEAHFNF